MNKAVWCSALMAFLLAGLCPAFGRAADTGSWVTVVSTVPISDRGQVETRRLALAEARRAAIAKALGANFTFSELYVHSRLNEGRFHAFPHGEILKSEIVKERTAVLATSAGEPAAANFQVTLKALVKKTPAVQDPAFRIFLRMNQTTFADGDEMRFYLQATSDCYLLAFVLMEDGRVLKLLPNALGSEAFLPAGKRMTFPGASEKKQGIVLQAHLDHPGTISHEAVYVLALQQPFRGLSEKIREGIHSLYDGRTALIDELVRHIITIPPHQRAEALAYYQIRPKP